MENDAVPACSHPFIVFIESPAKKFSLGTCYECMEVVPDPGFMYWMDPARFGYASQPRVWVGWRQPKPAELPTVGFFGGVPIGGAPMEEKSDA